VVRHVIQLVNLSVMRIEDLLESCRHILEEMKAVGDLRGFWSSLPNAGGIGFGAVAGDNRGRPPRHECQGLHPCSAFAH
jgi:hypothetical protein